MLVADLGLLDAHLRQQSQFLEPVIVYSESLAILVSINFRILLRPSGLPDIQVFLPAGSLFTPQGGIEKATVRQPGNRFGDSGGQSLENIQFEVFRRC